MSTYARSIGTGRAAHDLTAGVGIGSEQVALGTDRRVQRRDEGFEVGVERRALRDRLFGSCSSTNLDTRHAQLYEQIWSTDENPLNLVDATVRLKGRRLIGLAVDPRDVHSNYFHDEVVHGLLATGN